MKAVMRWLAVLLILPSLALASSETGEHASGSADFIGKVVNFVILFGGLAFILAKPLRHFLENWAAEIDRTLKESEEKSRLADQRLREIQERLSGLENEITALKKKAESEGRSEKEKILRLAKEEGERTRQFARQEIESHTRASIRELREYAARLAVERALERIRRKLNPMTQSELIDKSIERLAKVHEKSGPGAAVRPGAR